MCGCAGIDHRITIEKERKAKSMNVTELQEKVAAKFGISKAMSLRIIKFIVGEIKSTVAAGDAVKIVGFGTFKRVRAAARRTKAPNGGTVTTPKHNRVKFSVAKAFKSQVW